MGIIHKITGRSFGLRMALAFAGFIDRLIALLLAPFGYDCTIELVYLNWEAKYRWEKA